MSVSMFIISAFMDLQFVQKPPKEALFWLNKTGLWNSLYIQIYPNPVSWQPFV